jgi:hypothetical protein
MRQDQGTGPDEMSERLQKFNDQDPEADVAAWMKRFLADPLRPQDEKGRFRPNPLLVLLLTFLVVAIGTFFYFSYRQ